MNVSTLLMILLIIKSHTTPAKMTTERKTLALLYTRWIVSTQMPKVTSEMVKLCCSKSSVNSLKAAWL